MGPAGIFFLAAGAILYWVVELDLPYVDDDALGAILMVAGIVALIFSTLVNADSRNAGVGSGVGSGVGTGVALIAVGAIVYWALDVDLRHVDDTALGAILMVAGAIAVAASMIMRGEQAQTGVGAGIALIAAGAVAYWAVELDLPYIIDDALALILMVAGAIGVVVAVVTDLRRSRSPRVRDGSAHLGRQPR